MEATIDLYHSPAHLDGSNEAELRNSAAIVIDVLRASHSIITAISNGCRRVLPVAEIYEAKALAVRLSPEPVLLCGERNARMISGFDLGNSPAEYQKERVAGRSLIFCSTNGSRALVLAGRAKRAVVGSFANLSAAVEKFKGEKKIVLLCAGRLGDLSLEDTACGGAFVEALLKVGAENWKLTDSAAAAKALFLHHAADLYAMALSSEHGSYLAHIGAKEDVKQCVQRDTHSTLPLISIDAMRLVTVSAG
jgi:2-phosphosulfolactate phosphatase